MFVWNLKGEIIYAEINFPESWHDSRIATASGFYRPKLIVTMTYHGFGILGNNGKMVRSKKKEKDNIPSAESLEVIDLLLQSYMLSDR